MAAVHLAEHSLLGIKVAIKVLNQELVRNENIRKRFLAEAKNMARMNHPHIVSVTDMIDEGDTVAFVMEFVDGETLKSYLERKGKLEDWEVDRIFNQMLQAVGYVHDQQLVHRDIKPSNFMLDSNGNIKLMDFGIAKMLDPGSAEYTQTHTSQVMGTPMYMSPEQITEVKSVTVQSDIYSLGVVLWQMVMGKKPYDMQTLSNFQLQMKIVHEPLPPTYTVWDTIIQKSTVKDPQKRFLTCKEFIHQLSARESNIELMGHETVIASLPIVANNGTVENKSKSLTWLHVTVFDENGILKAGMVNRHGDWVIQPIFDWVEDFSEQGYARAKITENWGFIDRKGDWLIQPIFDWVGHFDQQGYAVAKINEKWGYINRKGDWVIQPIFDRIGVFDYQGYAQAEINEKWGFIDQKGNWVIQPIFDWIGHLDQQGYAEAEINEKWGFIDRQGNWMIQPLFDLTMPFDRQDYAAAQKNEKWGFINRKGDWVIQPIFDWVGHFDQHEYAEAKINEKWGFIDRQGLWKIQPFYDAIYGFDDKDYCSVEINAKYGFINRKGDWIIHPKYDNVYFDGFKNDLTAAHVKGKSGLINREGNWIAEPVYDNIIYEGDGYWIAKYRGKYSIIDKRGEHLTDYVHYIKKVDNETFKVSVDNKYGFMNSSGQWIIEARFDYVKDDEDYRPMKWNESKKEWGRADPRNLLTITMDVIHDVFGHLNNAYKIYYGVGIPLKKLAYFSSNFNEEFILGSELLIYYDDTIFGKGDDGFLILRNGINYYLLISVFSGIKIALNLNYDERWAYVTDCNFTNSGGVHIATTGQDGKVTDYHLGFINAPGEALVDFINQHILHNE